MNIYCSVASLPQITTLVNHREKPRLSERTKQALERVGQAVNMAVGRFVAVGDSIVEDHPELRQEMEEACREARNAGICVWTVVVSLSLK